MNVLYLGPAEMVEHVEAELPSHFTVHHATDDAAVDAALPESVAVLDAYMKVRFGADRLGRAKRLRLFVTATTGADHIDHDALERRGIPLLTLRGQTDLLAELTPAAEHSWLLLLACARRLRGAVDGVLAGKWERTDFPGVMLRGKTLGLLGCGRIGQWMARYARAFGLDVIGYDPHIDPWPPIIEAASMDDVLARSDIISIHVPLNEETRGLVDRAAFDRMRYGTILVNTSRGDILDESALLRALQTRRVAAAGLDVLQGEPDIADHPLVQYAQSNTNLIITPHIGGFSPDAVRRVLSFSCYRLANYLSNGRSG